MHYLHLKPNLKLTYLPPSEPKSGSVLFFYELRSNVDFYWNRICIVLYFLSCVFVVPGPNGDLAGGGFSMLTMMMIGWLVIATALFLLRPASLRRQSNEKPSGTVRVCCVSVHL